MLACASPGPPACSHRLKGGDPFAPNNTNSDMRVPRVNLACPRGNSRHPREDPEAPRSVSLPLRTGPSWGLQALLGPCPCCRPPSRGPRDAPPPQTLAGCASVSRDKVSSSVPQGLGWELGQSCPLSPAPGGVPVLAEAPAFIHCSPNYPVCGFLAPLAPPPLDGPPRCAWLEPQPLLSGCFVWNVSPPFSAWRIPAHPWG